MRLHGFVVRVAIACIAVTGCKSEFNGGFGVAGHAAALASTAPIDVTAVPYAPTPDSDPFYAQPNPVPDVPPGTILNSREIAFKPGLSLPLGNPAWQLQYMTRDVNGRPIAAVTTVVKPLIHSTTGSAPLVSYQFAYDSLGNSCTPSKTLAGGQDNANNQAETLVYVTGLTAHGWTMVFPDYEGPYNAYGAGPLAGQLTLDSIRAALNFEPLGLSEQTPIGMWGYSGGALATAWAASLHPSYAPELNIVGVASGGTPTDVFEAVKGSEDKPFFGLIFTAVVGANRAFPELIPDHLLNDKGRAAIESVRDVCVGGGGVLGIGGGPSGKLADYTTVQDPYSTPGAVAVRAKVTLPKPGHSPTADIFVYHEILDELLPIAGTDAMVKAWCTDGAHVSYYRMADGEHLSGVASGAPFALAYLIGQFEGSPLPVVPPTSQRCN